MSQLFTIFVTNYCLECLLTMHTFGAFLFRTILNFTNFIKLSILFLLLNSRQGSVLYTPIN